MVCEVGNWGIGDWGLEDWGLVYVGMLIAWGLWCDGTDALLFEGWLDLFDWGGGGGGAAGKIAIGDNVYGFDLLICLRGCHKAPFAHEISDGLGFDAIYALLRNYDIARENNALFLRKVLGLFGNCIDLTGRIGHFYIACGGNYSCKGVSFLYIGADREGCVGILCLTR